MEQTSRTSGICFVIIHQNNSRLAENLLLILPELLTVYAQAHGQQKSLGKTLAATIQCYRLAKLSFGVDSKSASYPR